MDWKKTTIASLLGGALLMGGCLYSKVEMEWSEAYEANRSGQVDDPNAGPDTAAPEGLDAETANRVAKRYYRTQQGQQTRRAPRVQLSTD